VPILYWLLVAPIVLLLLGVQIHRPLNINRIAVLLALLALAAPSFCMLFPSTLVLYGTFGQSLVPLTGGYFYIQESYVTMIYAFVFMVAPQLLFTGQLWRYYRGIATRKKTTLFGIVSLAFSYVLFAFTYAVGGSYSFTVPSMLALFLVIGAIVWRSHLGTATESAKVRSDIVCIASFCVLFVTMYLSVGYWFSVVIPFPLASITGLVIMQLLPP